MWIVLICVVYLGALIALFVLLSRKHLAVDRQLKGNLNIVKEERKTKEAILDELFQLSLGLVTDDQYEEVEKELEDVQETIRAEKGRLTITEAELEAIDTRLRELEELKRELEVSNMDAVKELDMLRSQERDISAQNQEIREELENTMLQLDGLITALSSSAEIVAQLSATKSELIETEKKCVGYEEMIAQINSNYMKLKKAYDALDIEYAQLYEKQQLMEDK